ncbi:phospholipase D-like domain-containing protein [Flavobacterium sp.]|uniref:phospholipase D-like domain-containing protein n=1 Tax=Flavobacterium sp. TaxID=239 RepID=UPI0025D3639E|nr:phospholipase D-like domain-containing protein [Flavobacterium sp.]
MFESEKNNLPFKSVQLVHSGDDYFSRLERIINDAVTEIHIQTYIFDNDATGKRILLALKEALKRQVKVYLLLDGFGSLSFPNEISKEFRQAGGHIRFFSPLFSASSFYIGRRLHKKVVVADGKVALIGGINIANRYHGTSNTKPWLDFAIEINSSIAKDIQSHCKANYSKKKSALRKTILPTFEAEEKVMIQILQNDWLNRKSEISEAYIQAVSEAKEKVIIVGSYFLPGRKLTNALLEASKSKVKIQLILSGVSDLPMTRRASCYLYSKLLEHNIELYEWNQSVLHGKAMVVDGSWSTIGSFNLNNLSSYASIEMNVGIESPAFATLFEEELQQILLQCQKITSESFQTRNTISSKISNALSYYITRGIEIIVTYLPYKRFNHS